MRPTLPFSRRAAAVVTHQAVARAHVDQPGWHHVHVEWDDEGRVTITLTPSPLASERAGPPSALESSPPS